MISWWLGRPAEENAPRNEDDPDVPETPAPVFAARALKSAIFGTPAIPSDCEDEENIPTAAGSTTATMAPPLNMVRRTLTSSPTKPQGILLTPGTATTRRKTVTFGGTVTDNESKSGIPNNCPGKFPSPWTPKVVGEEGKHARKTSLMRTMEAAREGKRKASFGIPMPPSLINLEFVAEEGKKRMSDLELNAQTVMSDDFKLLKGDRGQYKNELAITTDEKDNCRKRARSNSLESYGGDMTLDLNEPHSQSGRYWKSEYERYHEEAKAHMKKLVKYKQLAKSYAKKKDGEAIDLGEKLREEQQKVLVMEDRIADLISHIADSNTSGKEESPQLVSELFKQTALAVEYRDQADQFQAELRKGDGEMDEEETEDGPRHTSPRTAHTLLETSKELRKARKQLAEMSSLRSEMHVLRLEVQAAERKISRLRDENSKLGRDFSQVDKDLRASEQDRIVVEESLQQSRKDYDNLKELAKSQRRDAEHLLKKRHDQVVLLRKEVSSLKELAEAPEQIEAVRLREELASLKTLPSIPNKDCINLQSRRESSGPRIRAQAQEVGAVAKGGNIDPIDLISWGTSERDGPRNHVLAHTRLEARKKVRPISRGGDSLLDSKIPMLPSSTMKPQKAACSDVQRPNENTPTRPITRRQSQPALREITNNSEVVERPSSSNAISPPSPFTPGFHERFSHLSLDSPVSGIQPSMLKLPVHALNAKPQIPSPRPSIFNISSSPPKYNLQRPQLKANRPTPPVSSRLSSMNSTRARISLPPERAMAAKARLERKKMESRMAEQKQLQGSDRQGDDKENLRF